MIKALRAPRFLGELGRAMTAVADWAENVRAEGMARLTVRDQTVSPFGSLPGDLLMVRGGIVILPAPGEQNRGTITAIAADSDTIVVTAGGSVAGTTATSVAGDALFISNGRDRHLAIHGLRPGWRDMQGQIREGDAAAALTWQAYRGGSWIAGHMRHDQNDALSMNFQTQHDWDRSTPVRCHIHWEPQAADTSKVVSFSGSYTWVPVRGGRAAPASWSTFWVTDTVSTGDQYTGRATTLFAATPYATAGASTMLRVQVQRDGTGTTDTYTASNPNGTPQANMLVDFLDVHYFANRLGTVGERSDR